VSEVESNGLGEIDNLDRQLHQRFQNKFLVHPSLTRLIVSFQANKTRPIYRWYKYKEAFSASLIEYLLQQYRITQGKVLDPFAGSGTMLFAAREAGIDADGIELLPIGQQIINAKKILYSEFTSEDFDRINYWSKLHVWKQCEQKKDLLELRITKGAYSELTINAIEQYLAACKRENNKVQAVLNFVLLCILESISYTRKDGQYLRWDYRSNRGQSKKPFNKSEILEFDNAITNKISEIIDDLLPSTQQIELFPIKNYQGQIHLYEGSCLDIMPRLTNSVYDTIITSPPYCNRYDYTRTYALELALLGVAESKYESCDRLKLAGA
jgi:DNA modification methylase